MLYRIISFLFISHLCLTYAADQPQWGQKHSRNMISDETGLVDSFDPETGTNIKWKAPLGTQTYATPVVAGGKVFIGTNNENPRDPRHQGDRGVLLCLDETTGDLCWQLVVPKLPGDPYLDWPMEGIVSPPSIEDGKVYIVSNRGEVMCLDINGLQDGNDGSLLDEGHVMTPPGSPPVQSGPTDADILWLFDMPAEIGIHQHDAAHSSILVVDDYLYVNTSNGVDNTHRRIRAPKAPSLIVLDKQTGQLVARDNEGIGPNIFHSTWSSPAYAKIGDTPLVFFGGGNGFLYAFHTIKRDGGSKVQTLQKKWWYDGDPAAPKENVHRFTGNRDISPSNIKSMPVFYENRIYLTLGGDIWWGKDLAWLKCVDAGGSGDISKAGEIWSYELKKHCCSTPSVYNGMVFVADLGKNLHCVDAENGTPFWTHELKGPVWASPLVADGKVYIGDRRGDFWIFKADRKKQVLATVKMDSEINATAVAANGTLYVATMNYLYAVAAK
ncbi:PQQ-binding-like beta-propeller repeat protein [candidate division KSB1 bacterium]|nr:PQQ-binding-like beta-propeller repeat protein [candidate division KSB1 bacterium]